MEASARLVEVLVELARLRQRTGDHAGAVVGLREANAVRPNDAGLVIALGDGLRQAGALDEAIGWLRRGVELAADSAPAWYALGRTLKAHADIPAARDALERELACDPNLTAARGAL
ncbi:MAG: tetratricopeptide repeat protein, partial [Proteobacteria bacterium]|nr:tetratricopeptide repeat protein [Pseudomonadota bacterium]